VKVLILNKIFKKKEEKKVVEIVNIHNDYIKSKEEEEVKVDDDDLSDIIKI
jgi:hypothetical protein